MEIPEHIVESLEAFKANGRPVGDFLRAVLSNDLTDAVGRADSENAKILAEIVKHVYWEMPADSWGSRDKYNHWVDIGGIKGRD